MQNNSKNNQNLNSIIPKNNINPFNQQTNNISQQQIKGPQFLFSQEQFNLNQPVAQKLLNQQQKKVEPKIIYNQTKVKDDELQTQNQQEEEEFNEDDEDQQVDNENEEDDDTEQYDSEEETQNKQNVQQKKNIILIANADKFKSVTEIETIRKVVNQINKELDRLDQEIQGTLIMSRINFVDQSVLKISVSQDQSYQQYLKEFEQFKLQKQVNPKSMIG
ncbi:unnamed protein product [Paramecium sonneborni]|uniref:Uncharacterized protein n=1 Tax=Paramecium sonneborni TaxID=65129 RepID=A0A8S1PUK8_9CILI|nr:unnamed protein product [Paramecium sonneborni]